MSEGVDPAMAPAWAMVSAAQVMGFLFAFALVWPLVQFTGAIVAFVLAWLGGSLFLLRRRSPADVVGAGLYGVAGGVVVTPVQAYAPTLLGGPGADGAVGAALVAETARGLVVWVAVCGLVAVAMAALGHYFRRVADRREVREFRVRRWYDER